jgi:hypothetical protein
MPKQKIKDKINKNNQQYKKELSINKHNNNIIEK